jgi:hypothetical protein
MTRREKYCAMLRAARLDEMKAARMYKKMARLAPSQMAYNAHLRQSADETMHCRINTLLLRRYC